MKLLFLLLVSAVYAFHYELEGHFSHIPASMFPLQSNNENFLKIEAKVKEKVRAVLKANLNEFFINKFEIHSEDFLPTAIFTAYLTTSLSREKLVELVAADDHLDVFRLKEIENFPSRPSPASLDSLPTSCQNGGFLLPNSTCACPSFFTGESCEIVNCLNGGIADNARCACPPGVYAVNCEQRGCLPQVQANLDISQQSFILVLNQKSSMSYVINQLASQLEKTLLNFDSGLFANYILVNYLQNKYGLMMSKNVFYKLSDLINYLNTMVYTSSGNDYQPTNRAILEAQSFAPDMKAVSNVFVFTDSLDSDGGEANYSLSANSVENRLILQSMAWKNRIVYFISSPPSNPIDDSSHGYQTFQRVAMTIIGDIITYNTMEIDNVLLLIPSYGQISTVGILYGSTNEINRNVQMYTAFNEQTVIVLVTVPPSGKLPKLTDTTGKLKLLHNGTRYQMYTNDDGDEDFLEAHKGGVNWNFRAWIQDPLTVFTAFASSNKIDVGTVYMPAEYQSVVSAVAVGSTAVSITSFWISPTNGSTIASSIESIRKDEECTYNFFLDPARPSCKPGPFAQVVSYKYNTSTWPRHGILPGYCLSMDSHKPTITCLNGGTVKGNECECARNFQGTNCEYPFCYNHGQMNPFPGNGQGYCTCHPGYTGDFCEILSCTSPTKFTPPSYTPSLAIVLQNSMSQSEVSSQIDDGISQLIQEMQGGDQYQHFILSTFVAISEFGGMEWDFNTTIYTDATKFQDAVNNVKYFPSPSPSQNPMQAVLNALNTLLIYRSPLFLFVDGQANDAELENDAVVKSVENGVRVTVVITPPFGMIEKCMSTKSQQFYQDFADKTGGTLLNLCRKLNGNYEKDPISQLMYGYGLAHHGTETLNEIYSTSFPQLDPSVYFYVDEPGADVFFTVNCPVTESFIATLYDAELAVSKQLTPLVTIPFVGVYRVQTTANNMAGYEVSVHKGNDSLNGPCLLQVLEKTTTAIFVLYSPDPSYDGASNQADYAVNTSPVLHYNSDKVNKTALPTMAITNDPFSFIYEEDALQRTNSCTFEFFFERKFTCTKPGDTFIVRTFGKATNGRILYRSSRSYCYLADGQCANGGYKLSTGLCKCPPNFGGTLCQSPKCQNYGFPDGDYRCTCEKGYTGKFCELPECKQWNYMESVDPRENNVKQITFVLEMNTNNLLVNTYLEGMIQKIVDATESKKVPVMYTLITFDQYDVNRIISTSHAQQFVQAFSAVYLNLKDGFSSKALDALNEAYKLNIQYPGMIYLFTSTRPMDQNATTMDNYLQQKLYSQVNVFYTPPKETYPSIPTDKNSKQLLQTVKQSGGRFLAVTPNSMNKIEKLIVSSTKQHGLVYDDAYADCSKGKEFVFDLESNFKSIEVIVTGIDVYLPNRVMVSDGKGEPLPLDSRSIIFKDNGVLIFSFNSSIASGGLWAVVVKSSLRGCDIQARVDSHIRLIPGFSVDPFSDFVYQEPFSGLGYNRSTFMTFRLVDSSDNTDSGATLHSVAIYKSNLTDEGTSESAIDVLQLTKRDESGCAYQYVSSEWIVNAYPEQRFIVAGVDKGNVDFQRVFFYTFPSFTQRSATCIHGTHDNYGQCICDNPEKWNGDYCQNPICQNGGTTSYGICICRNGYYGENCEKYVKP